VKGAFALVAATFACAFAAMPRQVIAAPIHGQLLGSMSESAPMSVSIVLPLRNQADLNVLLGRLYDPADPLYGHYLNPQEFVQRYGPSLDDIDAVAAFAAKHSLQVGQVSGNGTVIRLVGSVSAVEGAFGVKLNTYVDADGRQFHVPDQGPTITADIAGRVIGVLGLDNSAKPQMYHSFAPASVVDSPTALHVTGEAGGLAPADVQKIYGLTVSATSGSGQTAGVFEMDGWAPADIAKFQKEFGIKALKPTLVSVDGGNGEPQDEGGQAETTLDIDMLTTLAPDLTAIDVYATPEPTEDSSYEQQAVDIFNAMASDDKINVASVSYGISELDLAGATVTVDGEIVDCMQAENQALEQMAVQGQTVCVAAGDAGAYTDQEFFPDVPNTSDPGSQPYVLSVGGTKLFDTATETYISETSWADPDDLGRGFDGTGGGGGISSVWQIPSYQLGLSTAINTQGSTSMRNVPDVSLYGDYDNGGYGIYISFAGFAPAWYDVNGTSASSPLWASFLADVNSERNTNGLGEIGLANPAIYAAAENAATYKADFHDIADGSNNLYYDAVKGYDNSTGWGSFKGDSLLATLAPATQPVVPMSLLFNPGSAVTNTVTTGTVTLSGPAPTGGAVVKIAATGVTKSITVPAGAQGVSFSLLAGDPGTETVNAFYNGGKATGDLNVVAAFGVASVTVDPTIAPTESIVGVNIKMTAATPAGGANVKLFQGGTDLGTIPLIAGETDYSTLIFTRGSVGTEIVKATFGKSSATATIDVVFAPKVETITFAQNPLYKGQTELGTVTLKSGAPVGGAAVLILLDDEAGYARLTIPQGSTSGTFTIGPFTNGGIYKFTAYYNGREVSGKLTVEKPPV
jgi:kumamolisin